jgi:pimeloyl-ACP methyl ester carboxylesterase
MLNLTRYGTPSGKPPVLIAHGLFGSARNWGVIAKRLSDCREVIAVDMRNHGASPWHSTHSYLDLATDLAAVLDRPSDVIGHSMGGKAAMALALTQPEKLRALIVADIAPVGYAHSQMGPLAAMRGVDLSRVETRSDAAAQMEQLDEGTRAFLLQSLDLKERKWRLNLKVLEAEMQNIVGFPSLSGEFRNPTLFLSGGESDYVTRAHRETIKPLFPNARFARIPGAGHWLHADKPREFELAVRAFLDSLPAS